jgi:hypothetical protein
LRYLPARAALSSASSSLPRPALPRRVLGYYSGTEDAFDMRTPCSRDVGRASVVPLSRPVRPDELWDERVT